jgi:hypothetical protein
MLGYMNEEAFEKQKEGIVTFSAVPRTGSGQKERSPEIFKG